MGRCLLLTDGLANQGITSPDEIASRVAALRQRRVSTSALGVGSDFDEHLLAQVAEAGGGNFHFIEGASQIPEFMGAEVGEALAITARDVVLVVEAGEGALVESLNDFPCTREGDAWRIELGSMFGGQMLDPVLRLTLPGGTEGATREVHVRVEDREGALGAPSGSVSFTWKGHAENDAQERDRVVDRRVAFLYAARAGREALAHNRAGDFEAARRVLKACLARVRRYAGDDPELQAIVRELEEKKERYTAEMDPIARKFGHYSENLRLKSRPAPSVTRRPPPPRDPKLVVLAPGTLEAVVRRRARAPRAGRPGAVRGRDPARRPGQRAGDRQRPPLTGRRDRPRLRGRPRRAAGRHAHPLHEAPPGRQLVLALARAASHRGRLDGRRERLVHASRPRPSRPTRSCSTRCGSSPPRTRPRSSCTTTPAGASSTSARVERTSRRSSRRDGSAARAGRPSPPRGFPATAC